MHAGTTCFSRASETQHSWYKPFRARRVGSCRTHNSPHAGSGWSLALVDVQCRPAADHVVRPGTRGSRAAAACNERSARALSSSSSRMPHCARLVMAPSNAVSRSVPICDRRTRAQLRPRCPNPRGWRSTRASIGCKSSSQRAIGAETPVLHRFEARCAQTDAPLRDKRLVLCRDATSDVSIAAQIASARLRQPAAGSTGVD